MSSKKAHTLRNWPFEHKPAPGPNLSQRIKSGTQRYRYYKAWIYNHFGAKRLHDETLQKELIKFSFRTHNKNFEIEYHSPEAQFIWEWDTDPDRGIIVSTTSAGFDLLNKIKEIADDISQGPKKKNRKVLHDQGV